MRPQSLQEDIGRNLEDYIRHKEDCERSVIFGVFEFQVSTELEGVRVGYVDAVEEGQEVEDTEEGDYSEVDFSHQGFLGGVRRADDAQLVADRFAIVDIGLSVGIVTCAVLFCVEV